MTPIEARKLRDVQCNFKIGSINGLLPNKSPTIT